MRLEDSLRRGAWSVHLLNLLDVIFKAQDLLIDFPLLRFSIVQLLLQSCPFVSCFESSLQNLTQIVVAVGQVGESVPRRKEVAIRVPLLKLIVLLHHPRSQLCLLVRESSSGTRPFSLNSFLDLLDNVRVAWLVRLVKGKDTFPLFHDQLALVLEFLFGA